MIADPATFIRGNTRLLPVPLCPEMRIYTADEVTNLWVATEAALAGAEMQPPFWAFPWAGGQALARFLLDRPYLVRGRSVLDVASGSGLVAIAAARAGARQVTANDLDPLAAAATALNAADNKVSVATKTGDLVGADDRWDVVVAGDIAYQADMAGHLFPWLAALARRGAAVFVGDPGRAYLPAGLRPLRALRCSRVARDRRCRCQGDARPHLYLSLSRARLVGTAIRRRSSRRRWRDWRR